MFLSPFPFLSPSRFLSFLYFFYFRLSSLPRSHSASVSVWIVPSTNLICMDLFLVYNFIVSIVFISDHEVSICPMMYTLLPMTIQVKIMSSFSIIAHILPAHTQLAYTLKQTTTIKGEKQNYVRALHDAPSNIALHALMTRQNATTAVDIPKITTCGYR